MASPGSPPPAVAPPAPNLGSFDVEAYIARYDARSETRLQRLLFLAHHCTDEESTRAAYSLASQHMTDAGNYLRYREEFGAVGGGAAVDAADPPPELTMGTAAVVSASSIASSGAAAVESSPSRHHHHLHRHPSNYGLSYDGSFVSRAELDAARTLETLETRLSSAQSHITKESIRTALLALAEFHRSRGELREALRRVLRSREYCSNNRQQGHVCLLVVELSVDLRDWATVRDTVHRAEHTGGDLFQTDPLLRPKLRAALGLAHLAEAKYAEAAKVFTSLSPDLTNQFGSVMSAEDVATYGALLGLATLDRTTLHSLVIDGTFKGRLELVPPIRDLLRHYSRAEYGPCLTLLQNLRRDLLLDVHLRSHASSLRDAIRDRCIVQYFRPYATASLATMGGVFGYSVDEMEEVAARLVANGELGEGVRINSLEKTLTSEGRRSKERRERRRARVRAAKMGVQFQREAESMVLRLACRENGVVVLDESRKGRMGTRSGRRGGDGVSNPRAYDGPFDVDECSDDDDDDAMDMEMDDPIGNPNDF